MPPTIAKKRSGISSQREVNNTHQKRMKRDEVLQSQRSKRGAGEGEQCDKTTDRGVIQQTEACVEPPEVEKRDVLNGTEVRMKNLDSFPCP